MRLESHAPRFAAEQVDGLLLEECVAPRALARLGIDDSFEVAKLRAGLRRCTQTALTTSSALAAATLGGETAQGGAAADVGGGGGARGYESPVGEASEGPGKVPGGSGHPLGTLQAPGPPGLAQAYGAGSEEIVAAADEIISRQNHAVLEWLSNSDAYIVPLHTERDPSCSQRSLSR